MPELPEVETIRRQLGGELPGRRIIEAWGFLPPKFDQAPAAIGAVCIDVRRRGKYLLVGLSGGRELVLHLGMTGKFTFQRTAGFEPGPHTRAWWGLDDERTLVFDDARRFGRLAVVAAGDYQSMPTLANQGPEPFDDEFSGDHLWWALRMSKARVKTQLLSQKPVAGVGNIYADEALWRSRVHPAARTVTRPQAQRLRDAVVEVLRSAVDNGGTTLRDYRTVEGATGQNQRYLDCYGRAGQACNRCTTLLVSRVYDGRTASFCPWCQRR